MKLVYFDLISGASGDMILGALVDAGLGLEDLQHALDALHLPGFELTAERVQRGAFSATKVDVKTGEHAPTRHLADIAAIVNAAGLPGAVRERALHIFERMVAAEAGIHNLPTDQVHLHELGAVDTIVDVVGALLGLDLLGVGRVVVSPIPLGRGLGKSQHGAMPLPAPATVALLRGAPVVGVDHALETVTPTAAALLTELAAGFGPIPGMRLTAVGYGAGTRSVPEPNLLRVFVGEAEDEGQEGPEVSTLTLLETNIDNMNPEVHGYVAEALLAGGALDVYSAPVYMKKGRPGVVLNVLCRPGDAERLRTLLFRETTTLGIRTQQITRHALPRSIEAVTTPYGPVRVKVGRWGPDGQKAAPEYEDCAEVARASGVPLRVVYEAALAAYQGQIAKSRAQTP
jgi:uncharacterized protein (TIGR00299 family) protein